MTYICIWVGSHRASSRQYVIVMVPASSSPSTFWSQELPHFLRSGDCLHWERRNLRNMRLEVHSGEDSGLRRKLRLWLWPTFPLADFSTVILDLWPCLHCACSLHSVHCAFPLHSPGIPPPAMKVGHLLPSCTHSSFQSFAHIPGSHLVPILTNLSHKTSLSCLWRCLYDDVSQNRNQRHCCLPTVTPLVTINGIPRVRSSPDLRLLPGWLVLPCRDTGLLGTAPKAPCILHRMVSQWDHLLEPKMYPLKLECQADCGPCSATVRPCWCCTFKPFSFLLSLVLSSPCSSIPSSISLSYPPFFPLSLDLPPLLFSVPTHLPFSIPLPSPQQLFCVFPTCDLKPP